MKDSPILVDRKEAAKVKRLTFKKEHERPVAEGTKTGTTRWADQKLTVGQVIAAVTGRDGKPAFLTPASEAFCHLEIIKSEALFFKDYSADHARKCGFQSLEEAKDWYRRERPSAGELDRMFFYEFKRVGRPAWREPKGEV